MIKARLLVLITAIIILVTTSISSFALTSNTQPTKELSKETFKHQIKTLEKGLSRADDRTLALTISPAMRSELDISDEDAHNLQAGLDNVNKRIKNGELTTTKNFTIYKKDDTSFAIQDGIDIDIDMWWGLRHYWCTSCAAYNAYMATNASYAAGAMAFVTAEIIPLAAVGALTAAWCGIYGNSLAYVNSTTRGVISDISYALYFSNYSQ